MKFSEFRAKEIPLRYGLPLPKGEVVDTPARTEWIQ